MKLKKTFALTIIAASLFVALFAAALAGCSDMGGSSSALALGTNAGGAGAESGAENTIAISGSLDLGGAIPSEVLSAVSLSGATRQSFDVARTAFPQIPAQGTTGVEYVVQAVNTADATLTFTGTVITADDGTMTYTVPVPAIHPATNPTKKYKTVARVLFNGAEILKGESAEYLLSANIPYQTGKDVALKAQSEGDGLVALVVGDPDQKIASARATFTIEVEDETPVPVTIAGVKSGSGADTVWTFSKGSITDGVLSDGVPSGTYLITFQFYSAASYGGDLLCAFKESASVFKNMQTDKWIQNGAEPWFETTGTGSSKETVCRVSDAVIKGYGLKHIYVDSSVDDDTGSGSFLNPKKTIAAALAMLRDENEDYTIYIKGTLELNTYVNIPDTLKNDGTGTTNAKSLTLCGATPLPTSGEQKGIPQDCIKRRSGSEGNVIKITSPIDVTIRNLKITGGYCNYGYGAGIQSNSDGELILDSGTYVTENTISTYGYLGAGVCKQGGVLRIKDGAVITKNTNNKNSTMEEYGGGGVCVSGASLVMSGGEISSNYAYDRGGGVLCLNSNFTMTGGVIGKPDATTVAKNTDYSTDRSNKAMFGGGVAFIVTNGGSYQMNLAGGKILYNLADKGSYSNGHGGGVYVLGSTISNPGSATLNITGSTVINYNAATKTTGGCGGGIYVGKGGSLNLAGGVIGKKNAGSVASETICGNYASYAGGGVYFSADANNFSHPADGTMIIWNYAGQSLSTGGYGGGMCIVKADVEVAGPIQYNSAYENGGGIYCNDLTVSSKMKNNQVREASSSDGGAVFVCSDCVLTLTESFEITDVDSIAGFGKNDIGVALRRTGSSTVSVTDAHIKTPGVLSNFSTASGGKKLPVSLHTSEYPEKDAIKNYVTDAEHPVKVFSDDTTNVSDNYNRLFITNTFNSKGYIIKNNGTVELES